MARQGGLAATVALPFLAAACSLVIDSDRTFGGDAGHDAAAGNGGSRNDSGSVCAPGCRGAFPFHCDNGTETVAANPCAETCWKGACVACVPGTYRCSSVTQLDKCNPSGEWAAEAPCQTAGETPGTKWCVRDACVNNEPPDLHIETPTNDQLFLVVAPNRLAPIKLEGWAYDEDRTEDLSGAIEWRARRADDPNGETWLGQGSVFSAQLENIRGCAPVGTLYDISATVVDRAGFVQRQTVRIRVRNLEVCPDG